MYCSISGQIPREPVVDMKTGRVYEKALIQTYLKETGTCPVSGRHMEPEDLVQLQISNPIVAPRPPEATSIPGLLKLFQSEWDSVMLECFELKKELGLARQELEQTRIQYDAACRVIARLLEEQNPQNSSSVQ